jgi:hypothetical protein
LQRGDHRTREEKFMLLTQISFRATLYAEPEKNGLGGHLPAKTTNAIMPKSAEGPRPCRLRHKQRMTLQQLSAASGVFVAYLGQIERGNTIQILGEMPHS